MASPRTMALIIGHRLALADQMLEAAHSALGGAGEAADEDTVAELAELADTIDQLRERLGGIGP